MAEIGASVLLGLLLAVVLALLGWGCIVALKRIRRKGESSTADELPDTDPRVWDGEEQREEEAAQRRETRVLAVFAGIVLLAVVWMWTYGFDYIFPANASWFVTTDSGWVYHQLLGYGGGMMILATVAWLLLYVMGVRGGESTTFDIPVIFIAGIGTAFVICYLIAPSFTKWDMWYNEAYLRTALIPTFVITVALCCFFWWLLPTVDSTIGVFGRLCLLAFAVGHAFLAPATYLNTWPDPDGDGKGLTAPTYVELAELIERPSPECDALDDKTIEKGCPFVLQHDEWEQNPYVMVDLQTAEFVATNHIDVVTKIEGDVCYVVVLAEGAYTHSLKQASIAYDPDLTTKTTAVTVTAATEHVATCS